jgi:predicted lactoylglutathione lyase
MSKKIFVNLPVADLNKAITFYTAVGAEKNPQFSDDTAACMVLSDTIYVMLLTHAKWATFTDKSMVDTRRQVQMWMTLSCESKAEVDATVDAACKGGGKGDVNAPDEFDFLYGRSFEDVDGHMWGLVFVDMSKVPHQT